MAKKVVVEIAPEPGFTGVARSVIGFDNQGFRNFKILTLHIENGVVVKTDHSDPYAAFEAMAKMELANDIAVISLNDHWENGKALNK